MSDGNRRIVTAAKAEAEKPEGSGRKSAAPKRRRRARPEVLAARADREATILGIRASRFAARAERARSRAAGLTARAVKRGAAEKVADKGHAGQVPSLSAEDIVGEAALEAGLEVDPEGEPGYRDSAPAPAGVFSAEMAAVLYPALEDTIVALGGAHWRLSPVERKAWLTLLAVAYPTLDVSKIAKPLFWIATLAIFGPRLALSVKQTMEIFKHGQPVRAAPVGESGDTGETGEREDNAGAGSGGVPTGGPVH